MNRCLECCMPDTRPDTHFIDGVCSACHSYKKRPTINWESRRKELEALLDRHHGQCIVPSSGGKDSTYQAITLKDMGADVTVITARTCHLTPIGRANIDNLARYCRTIEYTPNMAVRAKLNRLGLELVGDISWPEHVSIFTTPFKAAVDLGIPLMFYGENPQNQYGGPPGMDQPREMTRRWVSEFGGFLGLRPADMIGQLGITSRDMRDYMPPQIDAVCNSKYEAHFLGQYIEWDSARNAEVAISHGMRALIPSHENWWTAENLDNAQTGIHDHMMYRKYGYGRGAAQISVDIREGAITRDFALDWVKKNDGWFPEVYAGVPLLKVLERLGMTREDLFATMDRFTNHDLFVPSPSGNPRPILKEFGCLQ